jgi:triosephosphate isomerase (TIM)
MAREIIAAGNWKMNKTILESTNFIKALAPLVATSRASVFLAVPYTAIYAAKEAAEESNIIIGGQNLSPEQEGAFTGEISAIMLEDAGAEFVLVGHSERRHLFLEKDELIHRKVIRALKDDLRPILCIGETLEERENKQTEAVLDRQIEKGVKGVPLEDVERLILAYEPVWAIGTGKSATPEIAEEAHHFCRQCLSKHFGKSVAHNISILYGGSVKSDNVQKLIEKDNIDGVLVGGASLEEKSFAEIVNKCSAKV